SGGVEHFERGGQAFMVPERDPGERRRLGNWANFQRHLRDDPQRAQRSGQQLGKIVTGNVLDDSPTSADDHTSRRDEADADALAPGPARAGARGAWGAGGIDSPHGCSMGKWSIDESALMMLGKDLPQFR